MSEEQTQTQSQAAETTTTPTTSGPASRADVLAGMEQLGDAQPATAEQAATADEAPATDNNELTGAAASEPTDDAANEPPHDVQGLARLQAQEARLADKFRVEREKLDQQRVALEAQQEKLKAWERAKSRAMVDPVGVLEALGLERESFEDVAKLIYTHAKGLDDPSTRQATRTEMRLRELENDNKRLQEQARERQKQQERQAASARQQKQVETYLAGVQQAVTPEATPLVAKLLASKPSEALSQFTVIAEELIRKTGEVPRPQDVAKELERQTTEYIQAMGLPVSTTPPAEKTPPASVTISNDIQTPTTPPAEMTRDQLREKVLQDMERGIASV
jgi:hypothetical protein